MHKGLKAGLLGCGSLVLLLALAAAGLVGWGAWREHAAIRDADALCASIVPGEPLEAVRARALAGGAFALAGDTPAGGGERVRFVHAGGAPRSGQACDVDARDGRVLAAARATLD